MKSNCKSVQIANGVGFSSIIDKRFKTNKIAINFITALNEKTVTANAIIPALLKKGHKDCPDFTVFSRQLEELYGSYLSGYVQKLGDYQVMSLSITGIDDKFALDNDVITEKTAEILCNLALNPILIDDVFDNKQVELEKTSLIDTIEAEINEKRTYAINQLVKLMCANEPFGVPKYGYVKQAGELTSKAIKEAYDELLKTARIEIIYVGCSNEDKAMQVFKKAFSQPKRSYTQLQPIKVHPKSETVTEKTDTITVAQSKLVLGFSTAQVLTTDQIIATKLMVSVLGGTPSSKLFVNVREKLSLCYYCAARYDRFKGIMMIDSGVEAENIDKARDQIIKQLECIQANDFTDEEMSNALLSIKNALNTVYDSDYSIEAWYLGQILSGTNFSPLEEAAKLQVVTREQIVEAAKLLLLDTVYILTGNEVE